MNELRNLREQKGISQEKLAEMTGLSRVTISNLENGKYSEAKLSTLRILSKTLDVPIEFFLP